MKRIFRNSRRSMRGSDVWARILETARSIMSQAVQEKAQLIRINREIQRDWDPLDASGLLTDIIWILKIYLENRVNHIVEDLPGLSMQPEQLVRTVLNSMEIYSAGTRRIYFILVARFGNFNQMAMKMFRDIVIRNSHLNGLIANAISHLSVMHMDIQGDFSPDLNKAFRMLRDLMCREEIVNLNEQLIQIFKTESDHLIDENGLFGYMELIRARLDTWSRWALDERTDPETSRLIKMSLKRGMVEQCSSRMARQLMQLLAGGRIDEATKFWRLLASICTKSLSKVCEQWALQLQQEGLSVLLLGRGSSSSFAQHIEALLCVRASFAGYLTAMSATANLYLVRAVERAFEFLVNVGSSAEHLAAFVDQQLRTKDSDQLDDFFQKVVLVFCDYLNDRDLLEKQFRLHLSRRMLMPDASSLRNTDSEHKLLQTFKKLNMGNDFTHKMEAMIRDLLESEQVDQCFQTCPGSTMAMNVLVVNPIHWAEISSPSVPGMKLPAGVARMWDMFADTYKSLHPKRTLMLHPVAGNVEMKGFLAGNREVTIVVSPIQMAILMLFNDKSSLSYGFIKAESGIQGDDLAKAVLAPLATLPEKRQLRILNKTPGTNVIEGEDDMFEVNDDFAPDSDWLVVSHAAQVDGCSGPEITRLNPGRPDEERHNFLEAAIVRNLKRDKQIEETKLIRLLQCQLPPRMFPSPEEILERIAALISRDFVKIIGKEPRVLEYME